MMSTIGLRRLPSTFSRCFHSAPAACAAAAGPASFIEVARNEGSQALLGNELPHRGGFDSVFGQLRVTELGDGSAAAEFEVLPGMCNAFGTLHGGATATAVDIMGTLALISVDSTRAGVSVDISTTYLSAAKEGSVVTATGKVMKAGRTLGFTSVELRAKETGKLLATGTHTKALGAGKPTNNK